MGNQGFLLASALFCCLVAACYGVTFSSLQGQKTLVVTASPTNGQGNPSPCKNFNPNGIQTFVFFL
ncbi:hypothetical protein F511_47123 [Dorcoceras hygrometricum]|uniref:Uncharacterized protein n=1 Tax=Dorcoceras hygrometricum TaxID=472368 RepID=A0A2Z6ZRU0_9LAMI|nr:hypothetical protein F511_47123 [Dorcoceras hygrometricum]